MSKKEIENIKTEEQKKGKRKWVVFPLAAIVLVLLVTLFIGLAKDLKKEKADKEASIEESIKASKSEAEKASEEEEAKKAAENHKEILLEIKELLKKPGIQENNDSGEDEKSDESEGVPVLHFPYEIPDSDLVVEKVIPYSGHFVENGTGDEVKDSIAIVLKNTGEDRELVTVRMFAEGNTYNFSASEVKSGSSIFIQERTQAEYHDETISFCAASVQNGEPLNLHEEEIQIDDNKDNTFLVMNLSKKDYSVVRAFYKNYLEEEDMYIGGITYRIPVENLNSGAIMVSNSAHYISGFSKIMGVLLEE